MILAQFVYFTSFWFLETLKLTYWFSGKEYGKRGQNQKITAPFSLSVIALQPFPYVQKKISN